MIPKKLYHYRKTPLEKLENRDYIICDNGLYGDYAAKPYGLWFSIEDYLESYKEEHTWKTWCLSEDFQLKRLKYQYAITLKEDTKILLINSWEEIYQFSLKYTANDSVSFNRKLAPWMGVPDSAYVYLINWKKVKEEYDCIMIAPYIWEARCALLTTWYYPWDCASGVIWNLNCIDKFELTEVHEYAKEEEMADNLQM